MDKGSVLGDLFMGLAESVLGMVVLYRGDFGYLGDLGDLGDLWDLGNLGDLRDLVDWRESVDLGVLGVLEELAIGLVKSDWEAMEELSMDLVGTDWGALGELSMDLLGMDLGALGKSGLLGSDKGASERTVEGTMDLQVDWGA